jgi:hypothetical protein
MEWNPEAMCQGPDGLQERDVLDSHYEIEHTAAYSTSETVENAFLGRYVKRGILIPMKWANSPIIFTGFLQVDII